MMRSTLSFFASFVLGLFMHPSKLNSASLHEVILSEDTFKALDEIPKCDNLNEYYEGRAPLHLAAQLGLSKVVAALITNGAQVNLLSQTEETPADIALAKYQLSETDFVSSLRKNQRYKKTLTILENANAKLHRFANSHLYINWQIEKILLHDFGRNYAPFIYPFFIDDKNLFITLQILYERRAFDQWIIADILGSIAEKGYPFSAPSLDAAFELGILIKTINASENLYGKLLTAFKLPQEYLDKDPINSDTPLTASFEQIISQIDKYDAAKLAHAYTTRENELFKKIGLSQLVAMLEFKNITDGPVEYIEFNEKSTNFFTFILLSEEQKERRQVYAHKFLDIASEFLKLGNLSGVFMMVKVFTSNEVGTLLNLKTQKDNKKLKKLKLLIQEKNNYKNYRKLRKKTNNFIPILNVVIQDLRSSHDSKRELINPHSLWNTAFILYDFKILQQNNNYTSTNFYLIFFNTILNISNDDILALNLAQNIKLLANYTSEEINEHIHSPSLQLVYVLNDLQVSKSLMMSMLKSQILSSKSLTNVDLEKHGHEALIKHLLQRGLSKEEALRIKNRISAVMTQEANSEKMSL